MSFDSKLSLKTSYKLICKKGDVDLTLPSFKTLFKLFPKMDVKEINNEDGIDSQWLNLSGPNKFLMLVVTSNSMAVIEIHVEDGSFPFLSWHFRKNGTIKKIKTASYNSHLVMFDSILRSLLIKPEMQIDKSIPLDLDCSGKIKFQSEKVSRIFLKYHSDNDNDLLMKPFIKTYRNDDNIDNVKLLSPAS